MEFLVGAKITENIYEITNESIEWNVYVLPLLSDASLQSHKHCSSLSLDKTNF